MKNILITLAFVSVAQICFAAEEECPPAADAAEAQNHNLYKNCDYSNKGINGVLHRAMTKKKLESDETTPPNKISDVKEDSNITSVAEKNAGVQKKPGINSAQQLQQLRLASLEKLAQECVNGFVVEGERYLPRPDSNALKLELIYHCL